MLLPSRTCPCLNRARAGFYTPPASSLQQVIGPPQPIATPALQPDICNCARYMQVIVPSTQMSNPICPDHKLVTQYRSPDFPTSHQLSQCFCPVGPFPVSTEQGRVPTRLLSPREIHPCVKSLQRIAPLVQSHHST